MDQANQKRIILIEDEDFIRDLYVRQLNLAGLKTDGFGSGNEGLQAIQKEHYDILLLDIMLPDINGLEILKQVKQTEATKSLPVILLTNLGQDTIIKEGFELGAEGYLVKAAYTPDQIVQEVKNVLQKHSAASN
jgi:DNA-binding response OmpR family regulator